MTDSGLITKADLSTLLSAALGQEKSDEVVGAAARELGIGGVTYGPADVREIFERLARSEGLVGVLARFAISRGDVDRLARLASAGPSPCAAAVAEDTVDLVGFLAPALGAEKARETIELAAGRLGVDAHHLSREDAVALLDVLATTDGIIGVVARFAKVRFLVGP